MLMKEKVKEHQRAQAQSETGINSEILNLTRFSKIVD